MRTFDYLEPKSIEEACVLLERHGEEARPIAGGTGLVIWMRQHLLSPKVVVSLARIPAFDHIYFDPKDGLRIAAGATHREIERHFVVERHYPLLHETFRKVAQPRIRNMGTIGGNLAQGDPLTDPGASLIALDAKVTLASSKGKRTLALEDFFVDYYQTAIRPGEILTEIYVPPPVKGLGWAHIKFMPRSVEDFATIGVAVTLEGRKDQCADVRIALNSAAPKILRAKEAEKALRGRKIDDDAIREAGEAAAREADPMDDNRGSAEYKREMVKVLVRRALNEAVARLVAA
jgi:carbon-monoxide dehydrogenase medium subunit